MGTPTGGEALREGQRRVARGSLRGGSHPVNGVILMDEVKVFYVLAVAVQSTPESGHFQRQRPCPLSA
jgi:hypothetical protein